jgi:hypothetical protein
MAIFHLNESNISRSDGRSAVACAAYRACEKLEDQTFGKTQDYTKKKGLKYKKIFAPFHTNEDLLDRQNLWNEVEKKEFNGNGSMKANARLAKEYTCALPHELTDLQRIHIVNDFCTKFIRKHNVIVDACIHAPHENDETDNKNYHVHIMFTTRSINENGELGKKQRAFNDFGPQILKDSRATFASVVNTVLEEAGLDERIDHRSYKDQGLDFLEPTHHEGHEVTALRRQGLDTEISLKNDVIKAKNLDAAREYQQVIKGLDQEIIVPSRLEDQISKLEDELRLTVSEEQELLAELANLDREEEQLQAQQVKQIDNAYKDFIHCQNTYAEYANQFYIIHSNADSKIAELKQRVEKTQKWLDKNRSDFYLHTNNCFYDSYHHTDRDITTPDFYLSKYDLKKQAANIRKNAVLKSYSLGQEYKIDQTVNKLRASADLLNHHDIELPIPAKPSKLKAFFGLAEYQHTYETLSDYDSQIKPMFERHEEREQKIRDEALKEKQWQEHLASERLKRAFENDRRRAEQRLEAERKAEQRRELEKKWANEAKNEPKKPNNDNNNDYTPW